MPEPFVLLDDARPGAATPARLYRAPAEIATGMYLGILSCVPTPEEISTTQKYFQSGGNKRQSAVDLAWALMNSTEFLYRH